MVWQKNLKLVLDTLATLDDSYRLLLVGTGYYEKQIHEYARQIGVMDRCIFTGRISVPTAAAPAQAKNPHHCLRR